MFVFLLLETCYSNRNTMIIDSICLKRVRNMNCLCGAVAINTKDKQETEFLKSLNICWVG